MTPFRCSLASAAADEPLAGTAPTDTRWLLLEHPGPWGRRAVAESRLPAAVRDHLLGLAAAGVRVQLVRRPGGTDPLGSPLLVATVDVDGDTLTVRRGALDRVEDLPALDVATLPESHDPLLAVCTNGSRDVCCAETGRPVAAALAARWPEATWETTHLGGHRFAGTLLALPSGVVLGRLDAAGAVPAVAALLDGRLPAGRVRGHAGQDPRVQAAALHLRSERDRWDATAVRVVGLEVGEPDPESGPGSGAGSGGVVRLALGDEVVAVTVSAEAGVERRASCADEALTATTRFACRTREEAA